LRTVRPRVAPRARVVRENVAVHRVLARARCIESPLRSCALSSLARRCATTRLRHLRATPVHRELANGSAQSGA
jgi:hypothetical protein